MKALLGALYRLMRKTGHPVLWLGLFIALYGNIHFRERLYWETPSIPFSPFCAVEMDFEPHRPIKGITMTHKFEEEVIKAMAMDEVSMKVVYRIYDELGDRPNPGPHIFVAPIDYYDSQTMLSVTRRALHALQGYPVTVPTQSIKVLATSDLNCKDVEGVVTEF